MATEPPYHWAERAFILELAKQYPATADYLLLRGDNVSARFDEWQRLPTDPVDVWRDADEAGPGCVVMTGYGAKCRASVRDHVAYLAQKAGAWLVTQWRQNKTPEELAQEAQRIKAALVAAGWDPAKVATAPADAPPPTMWEMFLASVGYVDAGRGGWHELYRRENERSGFSFAGLAKFGLGIAGVWLAGKALGALVELKRRR